MTTPSKEAKLMQQTEAARGRFEKLYRRAEKSPGQDTLLDEAMQELSNADEQLRVAMEELRWQNDQLIATRGLAEAQRRHYRELFELAPDGYLVTDTAGTIQEANHKAAELLGMRQDFLMGKPIVVFIPPEKHKTFRDLIVKLARSEAAPDWELEVEMQPRDGPAFPAAVTVSTIRQSQASGRRPIGLRWLVRDMTERRLVQERIRSDFRRIATLRDINAAITSTLDLRTVVDLLLEKLENFFPYPTAATVRLFNRETGELECFSCRNIDPVEWREYGRRSPGPRAEEVIRSKAAAIIRNVQTDPRTSRPDFYKRNGLVSYLGAPLIVKENALGVLSLYTKEEREFGVEEIEFLSSAGTQAAIAIENSRLFEQIKKQAIELEKSREELEERVRERTSELARTNEMLTAEVAERKRVEAALRESERKLSRLAREQEEQLIASDRLVSIGELAASIAHEFNNPLQIILGFAQELLNEAKPSEPQHEALQIIETETRRCKDLIRNLLDFARPVQAKPELSAVEPIIRDGVKLAWHYLLASKVTLETDIQPDLPRIHADPNQLQQVLINLLFNAAEAMPKGGALTVRAAPDADGVELLIAVSDTGTGISAEALPDIFRPFFSTKKKKGMGLGLSICERIIRAHGGKITVESAPGRGTTFYLHFPLTEAKSYDRAS